MLKYMRLQTRNNSGCCGSCQFKQLHWVLKQEHTYQWKADTLLSKSTTEVSNI